MNIALEIEHRANVMFAELKGLTLHDGSVESLEQKDMQEGMEEKVRRVRTPAGVRRFKKPIGSIIGRGGKVFQNITIEDPVFDGWDLVKDKKGKKYDVGREGGKWQAYGHNDWDDLVAEADSEDDLYEALDRKAGGAKKPVPVKKPSAERPKISRAQAEEVARLESNAEKGRYLELRKAGETHKRAIARVEGERSGDHTGGLSNERSKRPVNVRTADDEERQAQRQSARPTLTAKQKEDVDSLSEAGQRRYWDSRTSAVGKANHTTAMRNAKATDRTVGKRQADIRKKPRAEWTDKDILDIVGGDARDVPLKLTGAQQKKYFQAYRDGNDHDESMKIAKSRGTTGGKLTSRQSAIRRLARLAGLSYADTESRYGDRLKKGNHSNMVTQQSLNAIVRELEDPNFRRVQADRDREADEEEQERLARRRNEPRKPRSRAEARKFFEEHGVTYNDYEVIKRGEKNFGLSGAEADEYDKLTNPEKRRYFALRTDTQGRISQSHTGAMRDLKGSGSRSRAQQIANERHGANKPKAERTDAEITAGLNNAFRKQFDTLSASQKRKYLQAFREGKTHSEAMAAARGGSGKGQGVLF